MEKIAIKKHQGKFLRLFTSFLRRFHLLLFFIVVVGCLSIAVILINTTLAESTPEGYTSPIGTGAIDEQTLTRLQSLHTSSEPSGTPPLPDGRINPFAE